MYTFRISVVILWALFVHPVLADEYLCQLSENSYHADSTCNPYGLYGNPYSSDSINNPYGTGNPYGEGLSICSDEDDRGHATPQRAKGVH